MTTVLVLHDPHDPDAAPPPGRPGPAEWAARLGLEVVGPDAAGGGPHLAYRDGRLELRPAAPAPADARARRSRPQGAVRADFGPPGRGPRPPVARACLAGSSPPPFVADATAGLGRDGWMVAAAGARVALLERSGVVAALLEDALARARDGEDARVAAIAARVSLHVGDAAALLGGGALAAPDVVYVDPMYPESGKNAAKNKAMALFRAVVGDDPDADALLAAARKAARRRVVVKRPRRAPPLAGAAPSGALDGTTTRFDLYAPLPEGERAG